MKKKFVLLLTAACLGLGFLTANAQQTDALDAIRRWNLLIIYFGQEEGVTGNGFAGVAAAGLI